MNEILQQAEESGGIGKDILQELTITVGNIADSGKIHVSQNQAQIDILNSLIAIAKNKMPLTGNISMRAHKLQLWIWVRIFTTPIQELTRLGQCNICLPWKTIYPISLIMLGTQWMPLFVVNLRVEEEQTVWFHASTGTLR